MLVVLRPASQAQETEAQKRRAVHWAHWRGVDAYVRKAEIWKTMEHAKDGKLITWVLVPSDDPETLDVLCTCTTYRREILILPPNQIKSIASSGYAIAAVFTPPQFRGRGYARRMMSLLHFAIAQSGGVPSFPAAWGQAPQQVETPGAVSVLYSGVGTFYSACSPGEGTGWTIVGAKTAHWVVDELDALPIEPRVEMLSQEEAVSTVVGDIPLFERDFESKGPSLRIHFAFRPTAAWCRFQMHFHLDHPEYLASPPKTWGARIQAGDETHFIVWTYTPRIKLQSKLIVVNLRASPTTFPLLFRAMVSVAREEKHEIIEAWNLDESLDSFVQQTSGRIFEREGQLPAMKWYGPEQEVVWEGNNK